jgi:osmoprotectant transport system permease protein
MALLAMLAGILLSMERALAEAGKGETLRVGSKRFTESYILAELLTQAAAASGPAQHRAGLGNTAIVFEALKAGSIDLYPDYTGTVAAEILKLPPDATLASIHQALAPLGLGAGVPLGFENTYALAVRDDATPLATLSDLAGQPQLRLGLSHEFLGRADGWPGLARRYGLPQQPRGLDHGIAYEALASRQVDAIDIYSTDAKIRKYRLRVLRDDRHFFPRYDAIVLYRLDVPRRFPQAWRAISGLQGRIDVEAMIGMNARAELDGESFAAIARNFLAGSGAQGAAASQRGGLLGTLLGPDTWRLTRQHVALVAGSVGAATLVGVPLGILAARHRRLGQLVLAMAGVLQTVPSLAMLAILIPVLGQIGLWPALVALFLYALLPIVRNTCTGLQEVPVGLVDAGRALGFSSLQNLRYVALPLATPVMLAGIKTAAIISVGTATIAAFVGAGGYGERIATGLALNDDTLLLAGAIPSALLALVVQGAFEAMEWRLARRRLASSSVGGS